MKDPLGSQFYEQVFNKLGRPTKHTPESLQQAGLEYFKWVNENPLYEWKAFANGDTCRMPKMRAMTERAFCLWAGIDENTFQRYKKSEGYEDFWAVATAIASVIYQQKFEGAAAEFLNPGLIARELGIKDRTDITSDDKQIPVGGATVVIKAPEGMNLDMPGNTIEDPDNPEKMPDESADNPVQ